MYLPSVNSQMDEGCPLFGLVLSVNQCRTDSQLFQLLHQVTVLVHLKQDVAASNKLSVEVNLRDRGPVGEVFYSWRRRMIFMLVRQK